MVSSRLQLGQLKESILAADAVCAGGTVVVPAMKETSRIVCGIVRDYAIAGLRRVLRYMQSATAQHTTGYAH